MSINTAHFNDGIIVHKDEWILLFGENVKIEFFGNKAKIFGPRKTGSLFLTTHRLIFLNQNKNDAFKSFNLPLFLINDISVEKDFIHTYMIFGSVFAEEGQNWKDIVNFKIHFDQPQNTSDYGEAIRKSVELIKTKKNVIENPLDNNELSIFPRKSTAEMHTLPINSLDWLPEQFENSLSPNTVFIVSNRLPYAGLSYNSEGYDAPPPTPVIQSSSNFMNLLSREHGQDNLLLIRPETISFQNFPTCINLTTNDENQKNSLQNENCNETKLSNTGKRNKNNKETKNFKMNNWSYKNENCNDKNDIRSTTI